MTDQQTAIRRAAVLIDTLDPATSDALLDQMSPEQSQAIRNAVLGLSDVDDEEREQIVQEFLGKQPPPQPANDTGIEIDDGLASKFAAPTVELAESLPLVEPPGPFRFVHEAAVDALVPLLRREQPQTIAVVISHIAPQRAADVLSRLPGDLQVRVVRRIVELEDTNPEVIREIESGIESLLSEQLRTIDRRSAGLAAASEILAAADLRDRKELLTNIEKFDRDLAGKLSKEKPTTHDDGAAGTYSPTFLSASIDRVDCDRSVRPGLSFDDLLELDDRTLAAVFGRADSPTVLLALTGAPSEFVNRILRRLPSREAKTLRRGMEQSGPLRLRDIDNAQQKLADVANQLTQDGIIDLPTSRRFATAA